MKKYLADIKDVARIALIFLIVFTVVKAIGCLVISIFNK